MASRYGKTRRGAQHDVAHSAEFYRQVADLSPNMLWSARADGALDYFNRRVLEYTGRSHQQLEDWGWRAIVHADDWERCLARWTKAFTKGQPYEVEYRLRRHDGRYLWHVGSAMPVREGSRIVRWFGTSTEIEGQKRAERLLEKARAALDALVGVRAEGALEARLHALQQEREGHHDRLRSFMDSIPGIAWIKDAQFRYLWLSSNYSRLHGRQAGEFIGRDDFEVWPEELALLYRKDDELALGVNGPVQCIEPSPFPDGSAASWLVVKFPLPDASGAMGVAGIAFDISEQLAEGAPDSAARNPLAPLSGRERQVMQLIVDGHTSAEVGARLGLSPKSVDTYRSRLMTKLGVGDLPALVKFALRHGLTSKR
jgi:PAS domain S-box-containing protein